MIIWQKMIYRVDMIANPEARYLFGDNEMRRGFGGQAKEMRGEPNAIGIRTKRKPLFSADAYWHDVDFRKFVPMIDEDFKLAVMAIQAGHVVIVPLEGLGTGMALLSQNAPNTLRYIEDWIKRLDSIKPLI